MGPGPGPGPRAPSNPLLAGTRQCDQVYMQHVASMLPVCLLCAAQGGEDNFSWFELHNIKSALQLKIGFIWGPLIKNTTKFVDKFE